MDDLHERAGSSKVLHLHGELNKARSSFDESYIVDCFGDQKLEDKRSKWAPNAPLTSSFFGEMVPMLERAVDIVEQADVVLVIGTSLQVYPANGLVNEAPRKAPIYLIDPNPNTGFVRKQVIAIKEKAGEGVPKVVAELLENTKTHRKMTALFKQIATSVAIYHFLLLKHMHNKPNECFFFVSDQIQQLIK